MNTPEPAPAATPWGVHLKLLGMTALWGASYPWAKTITGAMPILTAATLRFLLAALVLLYWLHHLRRLRSLLTLSRRQWGAMALAALFGITVYTASFMYGVQRMPAGKAAVLFSLSPVLTLLSAAWFFGERLNARIIAGMALAVCGSAVVIAQGNPLTLLHGGIGTGEILIGFCILCWTAYTLIGRRVLGGMDALITTVCTLLLGALMLLPFALAIDGTAAWGALARATPGLPCPASSSARPYSPTSGTSTASAASARGRRRATLPLSPSSACFSPPSGCTKACTGR